MGPFGGPERLHQQVSGEKAALITQQLDTKLDFSVLPSGRRAYKIWKNRKKKLIRPKVG